MASSETLAILQRMLNTPESLSYEVVEKNLECMSVLVKTADCDAAVSMFESTSKKLICKVPQGDKTKIYLSL